MDEVGIGELALIFIAGCMSLISFSAVVMSALYLEKIASAVIRIEKRLNDDQNSN